MSRKDQNWCKLVHDHDQSSLLKFKLRSSSRLFWILVICPNGGLSLMSGGTAVESGKTQPPWWLAAISYDLYAGLAIWRSGWFFRGSGSWFSYRLGVFRLKQKYKYITIMNVEAGIIRCLGTILQEIKSCSEDYLHEASHNLKPCSICRVI